METSSIKSTQELVKYFQENVTAIPEEREKRQTINLILEDLYNISKVDLLINKEICLKSLNEIKPITEVVNLLNLHTPAQQIVGFSYFLGQKYKVNQNVLTPRPETEELIGLIIDTIPSPINILDIGTGSGCIAISLALAYPSATIHSIDISPAALETAKENATALAVNNVVFHQDNILNPQKQYTQFDVIVSNPPYITNKEASLMHDNVLKHEPHLALFVEDHEPLLFYDTIVRFSQAHLRNKGHLFFEINEHFHEETKSLFTESYQDIKCVYDIFEKPRIVFGKKIK